MRVKQEFLNLAGRLQTSPRVIADVFGLNPDFVERLLNRRGYFCRDGESTADMVSRIYGADDVCPFESGNQNN